MIDLFVYGTLRHPSVVQHVVGRSVKSLPATLANHEIFPVENQYYPAILPQPGSLVTGECLLNIEPKTLFWLDTYEGIEYQRKPVIVETTRGPRPAHVYVWRECFVAKLGRPGWSYDEFCQKSLFLYLKQIAS